VKDCKAFPYNDFCLNGIPEAWDCTKCACMIASLCYPEVRCMSGRQPVSVILWPEGHRCLTHLQYDTDVMWYYSTN